MAVTKNEFHQHPDGWVYVRTPNGIYNDTRENFERDSGRKLRALPEGANEHIYTQGVRHCFMGDGNIIEGGEREDAELDEIINSVASLLEKKRVRDEKAAQPPPR